MEFCRECCKYVEELVFDRRLDWLYRTKGICQPCHEVVSLRSMLRCIHCSEMFFRDQGWPRDACPQCRIQDIMLQSHTVYAVLKRPMDSIAPRTLTIEQWMSTLQHFCGLCAYCRERAYEVLEHFIPICIGGGTEVCNCVPACVSCNASKKNIHPELVTSIPRMDIERVREYLTSFEKS